MATGVIRKKYIPYNGYYHLEVERRLKMATTDGWLELEMGNMEDQISKSEAGSTEHEAALKAYERLEAIRMGRKRLEVESDRELTRSVSELNRARAEVVKTCIGTFALFGSIILIAAIEMEHPVGRTLIGLATKVLPKVV